MFCEEMERKDFFKEEEKIPTKQKILSEGVFEMFLCIKWCVHVFLHGEAVVGNADPKTNREG